MSHDIKLSGSHDFTKLLDIIEGHNFTKLLDSIVSQPWKNIEFVPKFVIALTYGWDPKVIIYFLWIESLLMEVYSNKYS